MKKLAYFLTLVLGGFLIGSHVMAAEVIQNFEVEAVLNANRLLQVTEKITYDFGEAERHGIFRVIPDVYDRDGKSYNIKLKFLGVTMDGNPVPFVVSDEILGKQIKIGDPDKTITGSHTYAISYETKRVINDFTDHHELYWNVTGNYWDVAIQKASFVLRAPAKPDRVTCYTGHEGDTEQDCDAAIQETGAVFASKGILESGAGLTIVVSLPRSAISPPTQFDQLMKWAGDRLWYLLPILTFFLMFCVWWTKGREPKGRGTIIAHYEEPRALPPALMAGLLEQHTSSRAITATILDLARRGYLRVTFSDEEQKKNQVNFSLDKLKEADRALLAYEATLFQGLFKKHNSVTVNDLKLGFYDAYSVARGQVFEELRDRKLFGRHPALVRMTWIGLAIAVGILSFFLGMIHDGFLAGGCLSAVIIALFGWQMPRMTQEGAIVREEVKGFKQFLSVTEKERLAFTDAPERTPEQFARFLPAAVGLGVEEKWADQFKGIELAPPSYMQGSMNTWTALAMVNAVQGIQRSASATAYAAPRSTGGGKGLSGFSGGSSGGWYGGGGGGSW